ncbi:1945_t:CDS:2 [Funneliformis caledonium]|uniref:1945_t:CDS:1 n=1 Tax=Funneliformis caledonium TaxID=1117310 RepID=A0A9N9B375_9GLOM|nr:1945_t:CDS:2 [Funneliformis caledonium]
MLLACVPAIIATFVEVIGKASSVDTIQSSTLNVEACFRADTGYHSCLVFDFDSPISKRACSSHGKVDYQVKFVSRLSDMQTSIDSDPICEEPEANVNKCQWRIPNHGFDMRRSL